MHEIFFLRGGCGCEAVRCEIMREVIVICHFLSSPQSVSGGPVPDIAETDAEKEEQGGEERRNISELQS